MKAVLSILLLLLMCPVGMMGQAREQVVNDHGKQAIRSERDVRISMPEMVKKKRNCFILMSKKDFYLYVYDKNAQREHSREKPVDLLPEQHPAKPRIKKNEMER